MNISEKNIIVCGYQKSGTTWATRLVAQLLDAPSAGYWNYDGKTFVVEGEKRDTNLRVYQSHQIYKELVSDNRIYKIVYIVRDPRDIVVSGIYHFNFYSLPLERLLSVFKLKNTKLGVMLKIIDKKTHSERYKTKRMIRMLNKGDSFIAHCQWSWNEHVSSYLNSKDILIIRYEDLLLKGPDTAKKIVSYFDKLKSTEQIKKDIAAQSFANKKKEFIVTGQKVKDKHMRKGIVGDWKNTLSSKNENKICKHHHQVMEQINYL